MKTRRPVRGFGALADVPGGHRLKAKDDGTRRSGPSRTRLPRPRLRVSQKVPVVEGPGKPPCAGRGGWRRSQRFPGGGLRLGRGGPAGLARLGGESPALPPLPAHLPRGGKWKQGQSQVGAPRKWVGSSAAKKGGAARREALLRSSPTPGRSPQTQGSPHVTVHHPRRRGWP